jgi:hypothetical protein
MQIERSAKRKEGAMIRRTLLLLVLMSLVPSLAFSGGLGPEEKQKIESDATDGFNMMFGLWKAGKYENLYEYGSRKSHTSISKENFVIKMKKKSYELASSWETIRDIEAEASSRKLVYIKAKIGYRSKGGAGDTKFRTETYRLQLEGDRWRIDLAKILRSPF